MTTAYYSLNELRGLPGLPIAERALRELARTWSNRPRESRGGGLEYSAECLPESARTAIEQRNAYAQIPFEVAACYGNPNPDLRPEKPRADAKGWYLHALDKFRSAHQLCETKAREYFVLAIRLGLIKIPSAVAAIVNKISITTLRRWQQVMKIAGLDDLNGRWQGRKSELETIDTAIWSLLTYSCKQIYRELRDMVAKGKIALRKVPSSRAISNYKAKLKREFPREYIRTIEGDAAYRNKCRSKEGSLSEGIDRPNQLWMLDGTKTDVLLADGTRYWIIGAIDVFSRRVVLVLSKHNNASAVVNGLLAKSLQQFGIPTTIKIDNGSEYVNSQFETTCNELEIDIDYCDGGSPWQKGLIERFFGTLTRQGEKGLPGYVGANIKERAAWDKIVGTLTPIEFQKKLDDYLNHYNTKQEHSSIGCTPMEKWAEGIRNGAVIRKITNLQTIMKLLTKSTKRKVGTEGIQFHGYWFSSESPLYEQYKLQDVWVKFEPSDASTIYCTDKKGDYLFTSFCPELVGMTRAELVAMLKKHRKDAKKYKQAALAHYENTNPEMHSELAAFERTIAANLSAVEKATLIAAEIERDRPKPTPHLELVQDAIAIDAVPVDPLDRYRWYRSRIHSGQCLSSDGVLDFLKSIESHKQNWSAVIESDLRWVTPSELWDGRPIEYEWELAKAATILKPKHESMPWRAYQTCYLSSDLTSTQSQFMSDFQSHPDNQHLIPILQHFKIYRADLLNKSLADNLNTTPDNWRFEAGYFQRYYQYAERDLLHCVAGREPIKNPDYDWPNHQSIIQKRKEAG
jgi:putative transposase